MPEPSDSTPLDNEVKDALLTAYHKLTASKPGDRSERARRYAVTITEFEKVMSYFDTMVINGFGG